MNSNLKSQINYTYIIKDVDSLSAFNHWSILFLKLVNLNFILTT
ncbi:hypothetical protein LFUMFP_260003 [Latilactobacillus fuchuensis]|uniref:Uncharacterized protein n=1 Tax=Latilactobacillus fuchuensis TaxID=164393 RepID=A0A2N9DVZ9_9LACO|nr:hypothetical protein LFUMFP_260003 [Latilactobacillus fuchuensis]